MKHLVGQVNINLLEHCNLYLDEFIIFSSILTRWTFTTNDFLDDLLKEPLNYFPKRDTQMIYIPMSYQEMRKLVTSGYSRRSPATKLKNYDDNKSITRIIEPLIDMGLIEQYKTVKRSGGHLKYYYRPLPPPELFPDHERTLARLELKLMREPMQWQNTVEEPLFI